MTLTQTEKGYPPPVEHVGTSKSILAEKGWDWQPNHTRPIHYPWDKAPYLETRKKQLQGLIEELDPHQPVCCYGFCIFTIITFLIAYLIVIL